MYCTVSDEKHRPADDSFSMDQDLRTAQNDEEHPAQEYESESNEELGSSMVCVDEY